MPRFEPFAALRYSQRGDVSHLVCPPYDVIDDEQRDALCGRDPHNAVRVELPRAGENGPDAYAGAAQLVASWKAEGVMEGEGGASFYAYRMTPPEGPATFGFIGALGATDADGLLPHEFTTPKAKSDRLDLLRATGLNLSPIWGLSLAHGLGAIWRPDGDPEAFARDTDQVLHEIWTVPADFAAQITDLVASSAVAVADGHHRWETARAYAAEHPDQPTAEFLMAYVVELSPDELQVRPIHRFLPDLDKAAEALDPWFEVEPLDADRIHRDGPTLVTGAGDFSLTARAATSAATPHDADSERVQVALQALNATDLEYMHDPQAVRRAVTARPGSAGILLRAVSMDEIARVARAGEKFPPKTTFFWPKPLTGFVSTRPKRSRRRLGAFLLGPLGLALFLEGLALFLGLRLAGHFSWHDPTVGPPGGDPRAIPVRRSRDRPALPVGARANRASRLSGSFDFMFRRVVVPVLMACVLAVLPSSGSIAGAEVGAEAVTVDKTGWWNSLQGIESGTPAAPISGVYPGFPTQLTGAPTGTFASGLRGGDLDKVAAIGVLVEAPPGATVEEFTMTLTESLEPGANNGERGRGGRECLPDQVFLDRRGERSL